MREFRAARVTISLSGSLPALLSVAMLLGGCVGAESAAYERHLSGRIQPVWTAVDDLHIALNEQRGADTGAALGVFSNDPVK